MAIRWAMSSCRPAAPPARRGRHAPARHVDDVGHHPAGGRPLPGAAAWNMVLPTVALDRHGIEHAFDMGVGASSETMQGCTLLVPYLVSRQPEQLDAIAGSSANSMSSGDAADASTWMPAELTLARTRHRQYQLVRGVDAVDVELGSASA
jgi:hypothetical protein